MIENSAHGRRAVGASVASAWEGNCGEGGRGKGRDTRDKRLVELSRLSLLIELLVLPRLTCVALRRAELGKPDGLLERARRAELEMMVSVG